MNRIIGVSIVGILFFLLSCESEPEFSDVPKISFSDFSKNTLITTSATNPNLSVLLKDSLFVTFNYEDGDGDLGNDGEGQIIITDTRDGKVEFKGFQPIDIPSDNNSISGTVKFRLISGGTNMFCKGPEGDSADTVTLSLQLKDRAGNLSNIVQCPPLYFSCQ